MFSFDSSFNNHTILPKQVNMRVCVWGGGGGGGGGYMGDNVFKLIRGQGILNIFKTKFPSLLIRFIITIDGKYKTSYVD